MQKISFRKNDMAWDAFNFSETPLTQPMMVVIGQKVGAFGGYRDGLEANGRAARPHDRQLDWLEDRSHYDLYDNPEPVGFAMQRIVPFLKQHVAWETVAVQAAA